VYSSGIPGNGGNSISSLPSGGPTMMMPGIQGIVTPILTIPGSTGSVATLQSGAGVPSAGLCTTSKGGSLYFRTDGTTTTSFYVCDGATGTWTAK